MLTLLGGHDCSGPHTRGLWGPHVAEDGIAAIRTIARITYVNLLSDFLFAKSTSDKNLISISGVYKGCSCLCLETHLCHQRRCGDSPSSQSTDSHT